MSKKIALALFALVLTLALGATAALAGVGRTAADPGVSDREIVIGATTPLSGPFSSVSSVTIGASAYY